MEVKLLQEIDYFKTIFGSQEVYELMEILKLCGESSISFDNYFRLDSCSQLLAEVCNIPVIVYSDTGFQDSKIVPTYHFYLTLEDSMNQIIFLILAYYIWKETTFLMFSLFITIITRFTLKHLHGPLLTPITLTKLMIYMSRRAGLNFTTILSPHYLINLFFVLSFIF